MRKKVYNIIVVFIVLLSLSGCANINTQTASDTATPPTSSAEPSIDTKPDSSTLSPSSAAESTIGESIGSQIPADDNIAAETININNVKADHYYNYLIVETYIKTRTRSIDDSHFNCLDYLGFTEYSKKC